MTEFLVDVNLPYKLKLWHNERFQHVEEINDEVDYVVAYNKQVIAL